MNELDFGAPWPRHHGDRAIARCYAIYILKDEYSSTGRLLRKFTKHMGKVLGTFTVHRQFLTNARIQASRIPEDREIKGPKRWMAKRQREVFGGVVGFVETLNGVRLPKILVI